jgi:hypothetical protein
MTDADEVARYRQAIQDAERAVRDAERLEGAREQLARQLKEEYGTDDPDELKARLDKMVKQQAKDTARLEQLCDGFRKNHGDRL